MENLNSATLKNLREVFNQMKDSRRHLRPILSEIASSIDKGFFIDAGSEEVNFLLRQILDAQEQFLQVEQIKKSAATKRIDQLEKSIFTLEQNSQRDEIIQSLEKIATLEINSTDLAILDAVKKVQLQADYIKHKASKWDTQHFIKEAERFLLFVEIVENIENFSTEEYLKVFNAFADNPLLGMVLTNHLVRFPQPVEEVQEVQEVQSTELKETELTELAKSMSIEPNIRRINVTVNKHDKLELSDDLVSADEKNFVIEKSPSKKQLTLKSFNNKLHELVSSSDPLELFKALIRTRIMFKDFPTGMKFEERLNKKLFAFAPTIMERLFSWGIVDKITWRETTFYFLNETGLDICLRAFVKNPSPVVHEEYFPAMTHALQLALPAMAEYVLGKHLHFVYMNKLPVGRAQLFDDTEERAQIIFMFSLTMIGKKDWAYKIAKFKMIIERELAANFFVKTIFIFAFKKEDLDWLKLFDTTKFQRLNFILYTLDGLFDMQGEEVTFEEIIEAYQLGPVANVKSSTMPKQKSGVSKSQQIAETLRQKVLRERQNTFDFDGKKKFENFTLIPEVIPKKVEPAPEKVLETEEENFPLPVEDVEEDFTVEPELEPMEEIQVAEPEPQPVKEKIVETQKEKIFPVSAPIKIDDLTAATNHFKAGNFGRGFLALHALQDFISREDSDAENWAEYLTRETGFILDDPLTQKNLKNFDTFSFWTGEVEIPNADIGNSFDYLNLAAMIKNFFAPENPTSYQIQKSWRQINEDKSNSALKTCPAAKTWISLFNNFTEKTRRAFGDCLENAEDDCEEKLRAARAQIQTVESMADSVLHSDVNHRRVKDLIQQIVNYNGLARK